MLVLTDAWLAAFPGTAVGALAMAGVNNPEYSAALERVKAALADDLRTRFAPGGAAAIRALPTVRAYNAFFKRFGKTYHVQLQLESVALKGKPLPSVAALVEAMFVAELKNTLLTAGHDRDALRGAVRVGVARGGETYTMLNGNAPALKAGDQYMADDVGIISSVVYGPDRRTAIGPATQRVLFTVYGVPGIAPETIHRHLEDIRDNVLLVCPAATVENLAVLP